MAFYQLKVNWNTVSVPSGSATRTVAGIKAAAQQVVKILEFRATHDGASSGQAPDITTLDRLVYASNTPGTSSASYTPVKKDTGRVETIQTTAATGWTSE